MLYNCFGNIYKLYFMPIKLSEFDREKERETEEREERERAGMAFDPCVTCMPTPHMWFTSVLPLQCLFWLWLLALASGSEPLVAAAGTEHGAPVSLHTPASQLTAK